MYTKRLVSTSVVVFSLSLCFNSCNYAEKQQQYKLEMARRDSIEKVRRDSIAQKEKERELARIAHEDSLAIIAWGDAKFGMSKKEVLRTKAFAGAEYYSINSSNKYSSYLSMTYEKEENLQKTLGLYCRPSIRLYFGGNADNEAFCLYIDNGTFGEKWMYFSKLVDDMKKYIKEFTAKYGEPEEKYSFINDLHFTDLSEGKSKLIAKWIIGDKAGMNGIKNIKIYARSETYSATTYYKYSIEISNIAFPKHPKEKTQQEIQAEKEKERKVKETIENAF